MGVYHHDGGGREVMGVYHLDEEKVENTWLISWPLSHSPWGRPRSQLGLPRHKDNAQVRWVL